MEKKIRIQLFDEEGRMVDDRTVSQDSELAKGPAEYRESLFRVEFTLDSKDDVEKAKTYLDQMVGNLPLGPKKVRKQTASVDTSDQREALLKEAIDGQVDQDSLIEFLRGKGFHFMMSDFLQTLDFEGLTIKGIHLKKYQWMMIGSY